MKTNKSATIRTSSLSRALTASCLFLFIGLGPLDDASASAPRCARVLSSQAWSDQKILDATGAPQGALTPAVFSAGPRPPASSHGLYYKDARGTVWRLKKDLQHRELQTSTEVISAAVYRHFGFAAPETFIVKVDGIRYSASRWHPEGRPTDLRLDMPDNRKFRSLRIVAAFLKDDGRTRTTGNRIHVDGTISLYDFGGTLGSNAQGGVKPGPVFSDAIGSFQSHEPRQLYGKMDWQAGDRQWRGEHPMQELYASYDISHLSEGHPWKKMTVDDARALLEDFRTLDYTAITQIVRRARYSSLRDRQEMIRSLLFRRNAFLEYLLDYLGDPAPERWSYWTRNRSIPRLTFTVEDNRPDHIGPAIKQFVAGLRTPEENVILFRGQAMLTAEVLSPTAREAVMEGQPLMTEREQAEHWEQELHSAKMDLNHLRYESFKYGDLEAGLRNREMTWWDRATALDSLAYEHSTSNGHPFLISASRALRVASRWVEDPRFSTTYRYVYVLSVPKSKTMPISQSTLEMRGSFDETEIAIFYNATPFIVGVYDTLEARWVTLPPRL